MDFIANQEDQIQEMLRAIGVESIQDLFSEIPESLLCPSPVEDDGLSEFEGLRYMETLGAKNSFPSYDNYLGAGCYEHHVPALVGAICSKSKFLTAYTPYQGEVSQGMLQVIFEFQSAICALTGLDVANASLYDGASACAEAVLMAMRVNKRRQKVLIAESLHPHYRAVVDQYLAMQEVAIETIPLKDNGSLDFDAYQHSMDENTVGVLLPYPSFFGGVEDILAFSAKAAECGALTIVSANPLTYGLFRSAAELGADIAVGDTQPLGIPMQFGGPHVGYMACRKGLMRQVPGRLVGESLDKGGKRCFVLTLQAREQHIRREKATSNICSNQALAALASLVAMLWLGKQGMRELALTNYQRAQYLQEGLSQIPGVTLVTDGQTFNEFTVELNRPIDEVIACFREKKIEAGLPLKRYYPNRNQQLLIAVTETKSKEQLDHYLDTAREILG